MMMNPENGNDGACASKDPLPVARPRSDQSVIRMKSEGLRTHESGHGAMLVSGERDPFLDFIRALAITLVIIHHLVQEWPSELPHVIREYARYGAWGVELFFVLSGWLIGGLFWREYRASGRVQLVRFWYRRWMRTLPPYLGGLALAWIAVAVARDEPFRGEYLLFLQNYYEQVPFFLVSWSLCVEEHFYLLFPLIFAILIGLGWRQFPPAFIVLAAIPVVLRWIEYPGADSRFGYYLTATHLHADGLTFGFAAAGLLHAIDPARFKIEWRVGAFFFFVVCIAWVIGLPAGRLQYTFGGLVIAVGCLALLLSGARSGIGVHLGSRPVRWVAMISYSIYLTHALVLHACVKAYAWAGGLPEAVFVVMTIASVLWVGWIFYVLFERSALRLRDIWSRDGTTGVPAPAGARQVAAATEISASGDR